MTLSASASAMQPSETVTAPLAEEKELYTELLRIQDAVLAGKHPHFNLRPAIIEKLKASLAVSSAAAQHVPEPTRLAAATASSNAWLMPSIPTDQSQSPHPTPSTLPPFGLPGLHTLSAPSANSTAQPAGGTQSASYAGLNPIFLEKADSLVRAEGQLKRQRIERQLQAQVEQRKQSARDRDPGIDAPSAIDFEAVLSQAAARERHISGLKVSGSKPASPASSSFDENDYYSSQVQSEWSSEASPSKRSDHAVGAFVEDERFDAPAAPAAEGKLPAGARTSFSRQPDKHEHPSANEPDDEYDPEEGDDEYSPPEVPAFEDSDAPAQGTRPHSAELDDENSEYEPGEIGAASAAATSPQVPVIRNHLTHIAAPQPNRVSPLAVAKGPSIELILVNGRPEVARTDRQDAAAAQSRVSGGSPSGNDAGPANKRLPKKARKRKRREEAETQDRSKKKRDRQAPGAAPPSHAAAEPAIKDEPISPPLHDIPLPGAPQYVPGHVAQIDLVSPSQPARTQYAGEEPRRPRRYEGLQSRSPAVYATTSGAPHRHVQRDSHDLRRVASLQHAQRVRSPFDYSYGARAQPSRAASMSYNGQNPSHSVYYPGQPEVPRYASDNVRVLRVARSPSPPRVQEYSGSYSTRPPSPGMMPPPATPHRRIVIDQYGNRYHAAEVGRPPVPPPQPPQHAPMPPSRASVAPAETRPPVDMGYERAPSRMPTIYAPQYEPTSSRVPAPSAPPPLLRRVSDETRYYYVDSNGQRAPDVGAPPHEPIRYMHHPASPAYAQAHRYETMAPPPPPMPPPVREQTSPLYIPREYQMPAQEARPTSPSYYAPPPAPLQYVPLAQNDRPLTPQYYLPPTKEQRQPTPQYYAHPSENEMAVTPPVYGVPPGSRLPQTRAASAAPGYDPGAPALNRPYNYAPQPMYYVDHHGQ